MPFAVLLLLIATLLPLAAAATLLPLGKRLGTPLAGYVATFFIALGFLCSGWAMMRWIAGGNYHGTPFGRGVAPVLVTWRWAPLESAAAPDGAVPGSGGPLDGGIYIDSLTVGSFVTITLATMLIQIFTGRSMRRDPRFARFFLLLSLACFATLAMVLSAGLVQSVVLLELVGFCASLLVGFRTDRPAATRAAIRMFLVNRVGDIGLVVGSGLLLGYIGDLMLPRLWVVLSGAGDGSAPSLSGGTVPISFLSAAGIALFFGAAARCAQFPLHVWAGDPAESVAPAAAMVHSVTLGFAGVYFLARLFPLLTPSARLLIAIVGATTLTMAALIATVQTDVKKVLAWGAVSQLGYMVLGLGVGSWVGAMFHLTTFVFFTVLLFLTAGAVIRGARGETNLLRYGGLMGRMPVTALAAAVGVLAICGAGAAGMGLSGYYSRDLILTHAAAFASLATAAGRSRAYWMLFALPAGAVLLTGFYTTRWWMLIFAGQPRDPRLHDHAREVPTLFWPVVVLAVMTALAGRWFGVREMIESAISEARQSPMPPAAAGPPRRAAVTHAFDAAWVSEPDAESEVQREGVAPAPAAVIAAERNGARFVNRWAWFGSLLGIVAAMALYARGDRLAGRIVRVPPIRWIYAWLCAHMFFDELYEALIVIPVLALARLVARMDQNRPGPFASLIGGIFKRLARATGLSRRQVSGGGDPPSGSWPRVDPGRARVRVMLLFLAALLVTALAVLLFSMP